MKERKVKKKRKKIEEPAVTSSSTKRKRKPTSDKSVNGEEDFSSADSSAHIDWDLTTLPLAIFENKPEQCLINLWRLANKESVYVKTVDEVITYIKTHHNQDVYYSIGVSSKRKASDERFKANDIEGVGAFVGDIDIHHPDSRVRKSKRNYPKTLKQALKIANSLKIKPDITVSTG